MKAEEREEHLLKVQRRSEILQDSLTNKVGSPWFLSSYSTVLLSDVLITELNSWSRQLLFNFKLPARHSVFHNKHERDKGFCNDLSKI